MIQITKIEEEPVEQVSYLAAGANGKGVVPSRLPIFFGEMANIPDAYDAMIITSDLQGVIESGHGQQVLLGEALPEMVSLLLQIERPSISRERVLVLLCGDLYADPWKRGSSGDPSSVWHAFQREFGEVVGVVGNHDLFDSGTFAQLQGMADITVINDPEMVQVSQLRIAGLGGIVGRADKPNRRERKEFLKGMRELLRKLPDILLLHQGPDEPSFALQGLPEIRECLQQHPPVLVCCGHVHWARSWIELAQGTQVLNADGKLFVFTRKSG
ncbi:metallophosphoesterase family protein [Brevibacillus porteri]|uniref:metallophosphoesterase family protein n=1 Tax=Brevibacillus porteri TaxID=2126350 RepID=UPI003D19DF20